MRGVGMFDDEFSAESLERRTREGGDAIDAVGAEVVVVQWGAQENGARSERGDEIGEIERHVGNMIAIREQARHVVLAGPAANIAALVVTNLFVLLGRFEPRKLTNKFVTTKECAVFRTEGGT